MFVLVPLGLALLVRLVVRCGRVLAVGAVLVLGWLLVQQGGVPVTAVVVGAGAAAGALSGAAGWVSGRLERVVSGRAREERAR